MPRRLAVAILVGALLAPAAVFAGAFEKRTGAGEYPESLIDRPLALPKEQLLFTVGYTFRYGRDGYNNGGCAGVDATNSELIPDRCYADLDTPGCDANADGTIDDIGPGAYDPVDMTGDGVPDCTTSGVTTILTNVAPVATIGYAAIGIHKLDLDFAYGITDNWTFWANIPLVYMRERYDRSPDPDGGDPADEGLRLPGDARGLLDDLACPTRGRDNPDTTCDERPNTPGELPFRRTFNVGDVTLGVMYQWVNFKSASGLRRSLVTKLYVHLPSGNESTAEADLVLGVDDPTTEEIEFRRRRSLITGTGTTDAAVAIAYKHALLPSLALVAEVGYVGRFEGKTQYIRLFRREDLGGIIFPPDPADPFTSGDFNLNGKVDYGDEITLKADILWEPTKKLGIDIGVKYLYRFPTRIAQSGFRPPTSIMLDENTDTLVSVSNGLHYRDVPNSRGFLLTVSPAITWKVTPMLELTLWGDIHVAGKNSFYLNNNSFNNAVDTSANAQEDRYSGTGVHAYLPMQALGYSIANQIIIGNVGLRAAILF